MCPLCLYTVVSNTIELMNYCNHTTHCFFKTKFTIATFQISDVLYKKNFFHKTKFSYICCAYKWSHLYMFL